MGDKIKSEFFRKNLEKNPAKPCGCKEKRYKNLKGKNPKKPPRKNALKPLRL